MSAKLAWCIGWLVVILVLCIACGDGNDAESDGDFSGDGDQEVDGDTEGETTACTQDFDCKDGELCEEGYCIQAADLRYNLDAGTSLLVYRNDTGRVNLYTTDGSWIVQAADARMLLDATDETATVLTVASSSQRTVERVEAEQDSLGLADRLIIRASGQQEGVTLIWTLSAYAEQGFYTAQLELQNDSSQTVQLAKGSAFEVRAEKQGGVFLGEHPTTHRILENGSYTYLDFYVAIEPGDVQANPLTSVGIPGNFEGYSVSNLDHGVMDLQSDAIWVAGALSFEHSLPVINLSYDAGAALVSPDGRTGFSYFSAEAAYEPLNKPIESGASFATETFYLHPSESNFFQGMENWASAVKHFNDIVLWTEKDENNRVPNGWNSWSTSGSTGGYGTDINETVILENLQIMADEFRDWGMDWFQIDDGYEPAYGDWWWREDRFPHGAAWMAQQIRDKGFRPGLWMAPMTHDDRSQTLAEHPDWFAGPDFFPPAYNVLDLTNPEVKDYLADLFNTFRNEWGFEWFKMDFSYHALFGGEFHDPSQTREEAYRGACRIIREAIGDDTFFLAVSALGPHMGLIDANRLTLDNMPVWDMEPDQTDSGKGGQQGFKPTVRSAARRYYLHERVWINHSDLIVFRSNTRDETWPRVTLDESQAFCSYVGMTGGIVKLGDRLVDLQGDHINSVRKLLPIYSKGGRPLDMIQLEVPEFWHLRVDQTDGGFEQGYDLVALFHWGKNWDQTVSPYALIPDTDTPRHHAFKLSDIGMDASKTYLAYEFWTGEFLGEVDDEFELDVPSHTGRVVALREKLDRPQFLGWNRHLTMGAVLLGAVDWDENAQTLTLHAPIVPGTEKAPFTYELAFYLPEGTSYADYTASGDSDASVQAEQQGRVLRVQYEPSKIHDLELELSFTK